MSEEYKERILSTSDLWAMCKARDAQIAALTEQLRIVEAERDEARKIINEGPQQLAEIQKEERYENVALRSQLATLKVNLRSECVKLLRLYEKHEDGPNSTMRQLSALRAELERKDAALKVVEQALFDHVALDLAAVCAALQPKDKSCQTA